MGLLHNKQNQYAWLGAQTTAQNVVPATAGLTAGTHPEGSIQRRLRLSLIELINRNASTLNLALVSLLPDSMWKFGTMVSTATVVTDATAAAQAGTTHAITLSDKNDTGSGYVVGGKVPWGILGFKIDTASVGASGAHTYKYWNGTSLVTLTPVLIAGPTAGGEVWALGEQLVMFDPPVDWAKGGPVASWPTDCYNLENVLSVADTTNPQAARAYLGEVLFSDKTIAVAPGKYSVALKEPIEVPWYNQGLQVAASTITIPNSLRLVYDIIG